jgi:hypothetical protein
VVRDEKGLSLLPYYNTVQGLLPLSTRELWLLDGLDIVMFLVRDLIELVSDLIRHRFNFILHTKGIILGTGFQLVHHALLFDTIQRLSTMFANLWSMRFGSVLQRRGRFFCPFSIDTRESGMRIVGPPLASGTVDGLSSNFS